MTEREAARLRGDPQYLSNHPCRRGHIGMRAVCDDKCVTCRKMLCDANKSRTNRSARLYRQRNPQRHLATIAKWLSVPANHAIKKEAVRKWRRAHPEKVAEYNGRRRAFAHPIEHAQRLGRLL